MTSGRADVAPTLVALLTPARSTIQTPAPTLVSFNPRARRSIYDLRQSRLVGRRFPFGAGPCPFDEAAISGSSSCSLL